MQKEKEMNYTDLVVLFEKTKSKIKEAGLRCDTMHMSPKVYDLIVAGLKELSGSEKIPTSEVLYMGLKIIKHKNMSENTVIFSYQGKVKKIEEWDLRGLENGNQKNKEKESA